MSIGVIRPKHYHGPTFPSIFPFFPISVYVVFLFLPQTAPGIQQEVYGHIDVRSLSLGELWA